MRKVEIVAPPRSALRSGGHVYNRELTETAAARGAPISLRVVRQHEVGVRLRDSRVPFRLWDSLFLEALAACDAGATRDWGLLLHYLPSDNPVLDDAERARLAAIEACVIENAERVLVTGRRLRERLGAMRLRGPVCVCEPGVCAPFLAARRERKPRTSDTVVLLTVANLLPGKGLLEALAALAGIKCVPWQWHVIGERACDAVYTRRFEAEARQLAVADKIVLHGSLGHAAIVKLMDGADLFVFGSRYEAYGMALAEAAARGLPAVTTDVGAASEIYRHGRTGFIAAADDPESFREHVRQLTTDSLLRGRFRDTLRLRKPRGWLDTLDDFTHAIKVAAPNA